jgi:hypothetical protein
VGRSRNGSRITVDFLPTELWIKIAQHTADLEQFNLKSRPLPYAQIDSLGHSTPTIRSLCATCRFFFDICLPLRSEVVKCFSILQSMHPKFSILKQSRLSMIRSLTWSLSAEGTELLSLLAGATQLSSVDIQQYGASFTTACEAILSLPNLRRLTLGFSLWIETPVDDIHLQTSSLESLTILRPGGFDDTSINILPFVDVMHRLPHLKELILSAYAIGWVLGQLVSDHSNPLALETLSIEGANSLEAHYLYNFLQRHGSKLRRLSIPQMEATPPAYNAGYLPSLESFFGQARPAISYVTPSVTEIQLNERNYHPKPSMREALRSLNATPASPASLRRLSLSVAFIDCAVLEKLLDEFPNLEALELVNIPARSDDSVSLHLHLPDKRLSQSLHYLFVVGAGLSWPNPDYVLLPGPQQVCDDSSSAFRCISSGGVGNSSKMAN